MPPDEATVTPTVTPVLLPLAGLLDALTQDAAARHQAFVTRQPLGPITGLRGLDLRLGNAFTPGLHVLHGSPGVGKTAFALQTATSCGCPALYVTCEMSPLELLRRHIARITGTYLGRLKTGELPPAQIAQLGQRAASASPLVVLMDATETPASPAAVLTAAEATRTLAEKQGTPSEHLLIVVDSLHSWADGLGQEMAEYDRLNEGLTALRILSKRLVCPVLTIAERNRGSMRAGGQSAGAGTRKIEYGAETVLELQAQEESAALVDGGLGEIDVELRISKNRNGATGSPLRLRFCGALQRYEELPS